jgi:DNA-binding PadR family transcriptional regulator
VRDAILALLVKEPAHGYELRQRLLRALGPARDALNAGQVYVTLARLERANLVESQGVGGAGHPERKVYAATATGRERVSEWLTDTAWSNVAPVEFHLKLVAAARTGLADPVSLVDAQRLELLRRLRDVQELARLEPTESEGWLLLEGAALRLQADIRWLESCEQWWVDGSSR